MNNKEILNLMIEIKEQLIEINKSQNKLNEILFDINENKKEELLTVEDVKERLKTGRNFVYKLLNTGLLPYLSMGDRKVRESELNKFIRNIDGKDINKLIREIEESGKVI